MNVPIDHEYTSVLLPLLETHGAVCLRTATQDYHKPGCLGILTPATFSEYTITFPDGTTMEYGYRMQRTAPMKIIFPDGYELFGAEMYTIDWANNTPLYVLHLPPDKGREVGRTNGKP